jgi:hypothetical protein
MRKIFGLIAVALFASCKNYTEKQDQRTMLDINLKELHYWWVTPKTNKPIIEKLSDTSTAVLYLMDYRGAMNFKIYNLTH